MGNFLPYGFMGLAVLGVSQYNVSATVPRAPEFAFPCVDNATCHSPSSPTSGRNSALLYGALVRRRTDYLVTQHLFLRGEFEYVRFAPIFDVPVSLISGHVGGGFKF